MKRVQLYHEKLNNINRAVKEYADARTKPLVYHLYEQGYTQADVAKILKISDQAVKMMYPKKEAK